LNLFFKKEYISILLDENTVIPNLVDSKIDIILSPFYYWVKRVELPMEKTKEILPLLPAIFEEFIPPSRYSYIAIKQSDGCFLAYAYDDAFILETFKNKNIYLSSIHSIYLAQNELLSYANPLYLDEQKVLVNRNNILTILPISMVNEESIQTLRNHDCKSKALHIEQYQQFGNKKDQNIIFILLSILIVLLIGEWTLLGSQNSQIIDKEKAIYKKNNLLASSFQNKAVLKTLKQQDKLEIIKKDLIAMAFNQNLSKKDSLERLQIKKKEALIIYTINKKNKSTLIARSFRKKFKNVVGDYRNKKLSLRIPL
jgi:hypothetical protein